MLQITTDVLPISLGNEIITRKNIMQLVQVKVIIHSTYRLNKQQSNRGHWHLATQNLSVGSTRLQLRSYALTQSTYNSNNTPSKLLLKYQIQNFQTSLNTPCE